MDNELISVIIPVYAVEKYLEECLESVVKQTYKNLEIILVDDGSPDDCGDICDRWAEYDHRIQVIHQENMGLSEARNVGIEHANGKYIGFVDSDDVIKTRFYEALEKAMVETEADVVIMHEKRWDGKQRENETYDQIGVIEEYDDQSRFINHFRDSFTGPVGWAWNKLYRKELIGTTRFVKGRKIEDLMFNAEIALKIKKAVWIKDRMYYYRMREDSITCVANSAGTLLAHVEAVKDVRDIFQSMPDDSGKAYSTYAMNFFANAWGLALVKKYDNRKEIRRIFEYSYDNWKNEITGNELFGKLFLARYFKGMYYIIKKSQY